MLEFIWPGALYQGLEVRGCKECRHQGLHGRIMGRFHISLVDEAGFGLLLGNTQIVVIFAKSLAAEPRNSLIKRLEILGFFSKDGPGTRFRVFVKQQVQMPDHLAVSVLGVLSRTVLVGELIQLGKGTRKAGKEGMHTT